MEGYVSRIAPPKARSRPRGLTHSICINHVVSSILEFYLSHQHPNGKEHVSILKEWKQFSELLYVSAFGSGNSTSLLFFGFGAMASTYRMMPNIWRHLLRLQPHLWRALFLHGVIYMHCHVINARIYPLRFVNSTNLFLLLGSLWIIPLFFLYKSGPGYIEVHKGKLK